MFFWRRRNFLCMHSTSCFAVLRTSEERVIGLSEPRPGLAVWYTPETRARRLCSKSRHDKLIWGCGAWQRGDSYAGWACRKSLLLCCAMKQELQLRSLSGRKAGKESGTEDYGWKFNGFNPIICVLLSESVCCWIALFDIMHMYM